MFYKKIVNNNKVERIVKFFDENDIYICAQFRLMNIQKQFPLNLDAISWNSL